MILGFSSDDLTEVPLITMCQNLCRKISNGMKQGKDLAEIGENRLVTPDRDGRLRNLLKKTYLRRWIGAQDLSGQDSRTHLNNAEDMTARRSGSMDFARLVKYFLILPWNCTMWIVVHIHAWDAPLSCFVY